MPVRRLDPLRRRNALARQRRLVDLQRARLDDPAVRGHLVAGRQQHDVADHHFLGRDLGLGSVATDPSRRLDHRLQRVHRALGLALLTQAHDCVHHRDEKQQHRRAPLLDRQRDDRGAEQDHLHVAPVLLQEPLPARRRLLHGQRVRPMLGEQIGRLLA